MLKQHPALISQIDHIRIAMDFSNLSIMFCLNFQEIMSVDGMTRHSFYMMHRNKPVLYQLQIHLRVTKELGMI